MTILVSKGLDGGGDTTDVDEESQGAGKLKNKCLIMEKTGNSFQSFDLSPRT